MNLSFEFWISTVLAVIPILLGIGKWIWRKFYAVKNRALSIEYIDGKQYLHKKKEKIELKVIYNSSLTCDSLVTLRIAINNCGKEDISGTALIDPIKITFSDKYEILDVSRVDEYNKIKPSIIFTPSSISLRWALLKHENKFEIDIIAKSTSDNHDLSVDLYNSLSCDINIDGIDEIQYEKQHTIKDKEQLRSKRKIKSLAIYSFVLMWCAVLTYGSPDSSMFITIRTDDLSTESWVRVYSKDKTVLVEAYDEELSIQEFNDKYTIIGISKDHPDKEYMFYIIYLSSAGIGVLITIIMALMYIKKKHEVS